MANIGAYSRHKMLSELNDVLFTNAGDGATPLVYSPAEQKDRAKLNLGAVLGNTGGPPRFLVSPTSFAGTNQTLTAAVLATRLILGTPTGASTYTTDTAALINAAFPDLRVGEAFEFIVVNLSTTAANDITVAGGSGVTAVGEMVVEANEATQLLPSQGKFWIRKTGAAAYDIIRVGS